MKTELAYNAGGPGEFPRDGLPEVAVMGRSNVGKSSLINALVGRRRVARTSGRPGKTRRIHFYRVADAFYLVDLPGYGYAAASREERRRWRPMVESYLRGAREPLRGAVLVVDLRRGLEGEERDLLEWLGAEGIPVILALTKADKLSRAEGAARVRALSEETTLPAEQVSPVSARTGQGLLPIADWIRAWSGVELRRPDGRPFSS